MLVTKIAMVYADVLNWVVVAAVIFVSINVMTPFLYTVWHDNLTPQLRNSTNSNVTTMTTAGNNLFTSWQIMGYLVPGIIIAYGFAQAVYKGTRDDVQDVGTYE